VDVGTAKRSGVKTKKANYKKACISAAYFAAGEERGTGERERRERDRAKEMAPRKKSGAEETQTQKWIMT